MEPGSLELNDEESIFLNSMLLDPKSNEPATRPCSISGRPQSTTPIKSSRNNQIEELERMMSQMNPSEAQSSAVLIDLLSAYHKAAMKCMESGPSKQAAAFELLQKAQLLGESLPETTNLRKVWLTTIYSSLAVYFQRAKKYEAALLYLQQAADLEQDAGASSESIAGTSLNIAAVLLSLGRHSQALVQAVRATETLLGSNIPPVAALDEAKAAELARGGMPLSRLELLYKAFYNIGAINEHLSNLKEALNAYRISASLAKGGDNAFQRMVEAAALDVKRRLSKVSRVGSASLKRHETPTQGNNTAHRPNTAASGSSSEKGAALTRASSQDRSKEGQGLSILAKISASHA